MIVDDIQTTQGMKLSYRLHKLLQSSNDSEPVRGIRLSDSLSDNSSEMSVAGTLYTLVRGNRANRHYFLTTLLNMFEDDSVCYQVENLIELCYITCCLPDFMIVLTISVTFSTAE